MTSLDRLPLTTVPDLDPSQFNTLYTPGGDRLCAYYSPITDQWSIYNYRTDRFLPHFSGIDATDWHEVWAEIISREQAG